MTETQISLIRRCIQWSHVVENDGDLGKVAILDAFDEFLVDQKNVKARLDKMEKSMLVLKHRLSGD
jgi:hypothetical protein